MDRAINILYSLAFGAWAAFAGWLILNFIFDYGKMSPYPQAILVGAIVGMLSGSLIAGYEKFGNTARAVPTLQGGLMGILIGFVVGSLGLFLGELMFQTLPVNGAAKDGLRVMGWGIFGLGVGLGPGIATLSWRKLAFGGAGGCLGGILGGTIFLVLLAMFSRYFLTSSAIGFTMLGVFAGLFIALAQQIAKQATLKIVGQNIRTLRNHEGNKFDIAKARVSIGSANSDDWIIPEDPNIAPRHIEIKQEGGRFVLHSNVPTSLAILHGQPVQKQALSDGDRFQIGATTISFTTK